jgi:probable HAF family extracellular repeat protein
MIAAISLVFALTGQPMAGGYRYVPFDVSCSIDTPVSACPAGLVPGQIAAQTAAKGINARGEIVGSYVDGAGKTHGFLLKDGSYTSLDFPLAGVRATIANGINSRGEIVGQYTAPVNGDPMLDEGSPLYCPAATDAACIKAFFYRDGRFDTVLFPPTRDANGVEHEHPGAIAQRITGDGDVYGCLHDHNTTDSMFGAVWRRFDTISLTDNGGEQSDPMGMPMSMNNGATPRAHVIVGLFSDATGQHGFRVRSGAFESYDPAGVGANLTAIWDINPQAQFVGTYRGASEPATQRHGFVQNHGDRDDLTLPAPITLDVQYQDQPHHTVVAFATIAFGINSEGVIVGQYALVNMGPTHGFVAIPPGVHGHHDGRSDDRDRSGAHGF